MVLVIVIFDEFEEVDEIDLWKFVYVLLNVLQEVECLCFEFEGVCKRNCIDVENVLCDLQCNVICGLLKVMDVVKIDQEVCECILEVMNLVVGEGVRERVSGQLYRIFVGGMDC